MPETQVELLRYRSDKLGFPGGFMVKKTKTKTKNACQCRRHRFDP